MRTLCDWCGVMLEATHDPGEWYTLTWPVTCATPTPNDPPRQLCPQCGEKACATLATLERMANVLGEDGTPREVAAIGIDGTAKQELIEARYWKDA